MKTLAQKKGLRAFLMPAVLIYTLLFVLPSIVGFYFSLTEWSGLGVEPKFIGLSNYIEVLTNPTFLQSFGNTVVLAVAGGILVFAVAFGSMVVMQQMRGRKFLRSIIYLPNIISPIAIGAALSFALDSRGALNGVLGFFGIPPQNWLGPDLVFMCIIVGLAWSAAGFYALILLAAVDTIPKELYEAAKLEGVTKVQAFRTITLPLTWDVFATAATLWVIGSLKIFEIVLAFTGSANSTVPPGARTVAVQQFLLFNGNSGLPQLGIAAAIGVLMVILSAILLVLVRLLTRRERVEF